MEKLAPKNAIMEYVWSKARQGQKTILLPETEDERTLKAAELVEEAGLGKIILIGKEDEVRKRAKTVGANIDNIQVLDHEKLLQIDKYAEKLMEIRKGKIASIDDARQLLRDKVYFSVMMVKLDDADAMIAGAVTTSADVERAAFQIIKTAKGISIASGCLAVIVPKCPYGDDGFFLFADCGGNPNPTAEELAEIAVTTCITAKNIFGVKEPRAAMLSFSTKGSGPHPLVDKVIEATRIANRKRPDLMIDGELQGDAALAPEVARREAPGSLVAGRANILIFPDLNVGNIALKLTECLAGAEAYGPVLQGLAKPIMDLSRGCKAEDIVNVTAIAAVVAMASYDESQ
jgi:phosphate acetyltransferase